MKAGRQPGPGYFRGDFNNESEPENCCQVRPFPDVQTSLISYRSSHLEKRIQRTKEGFDLILSFKRWAHAREHTRTHNLTHTHAPSYHKLSSWNSTKYFKYLELILKRALPAKPIQDAPLGLAFLSSSQTQERSYGKWQLLRKDGHCRQNRKNPTFPALKPVHFTGHWKCLCCCILKETLSAPGGLAGCRLWVTALDLAICWLLCKINYLGHLNVFPKHNIISLQTTPYQSESPTKFHLGNWR